MGSKIKAIQILQAAGYILLGLFLVLKPDTSVRAICYGCGVIAAAYGLLHVLQCRKGKAKGELILGVIFIALGVFCLITPQTVVSFLPFLLGVVLMLDGISKIQRALDLRVLDAIGWGKLLTIGLFCAHWRASRELDAALIFLASFRWPKSTANRAARC